MSVTAFYLHEKIRNTWGIVLSELGRKEGTRSRIRTLFTSLKASITNRVTFVFADKQSSTALTEIQTHTDYCFMCLSTKLYKTQCDASLAHAKHSSNKLQDENPAILE